MITTLSGDNDYARHQALSRITTDFISQHGELAIEQLDGREASYERLRQAVVSLPFLSKRKLVVLSQAGAQKQFAETIDEIIKSLPETNDVVLVEPKLDRRLTYYKSLTRLTDFRDHPALDTNSLAKWLVKEAKQSGGELGLGDANYLVERLGDNQQMLASELTKLLLYDKKISRVSIDSLTEPTPQGTIFQLMEAAFNGQQKRIISMYGRQRALKVQPAEIIAMLVWQLRVLLLVKAAGDKSSSDIAREGKLNPYVIQKSRRITQNLSLSSLKQLISELLNIDLAIKQTAVDSDELLQQYLLRITELSPA